MNDFIRTPRIIHPWYEHFDSLFEFLPEAIRREREIKEDLRNGRISAIPEVDILYRKVVKNYENQRKRI